MSPGEAKLVKRVQHDDYLRSLRAAPNHQESPSIRMNIVGGSVRVRDVWFIVEEHRPMR